MSASVTVAFITQFETEVHMAFQREGSKLMGFTRSKAVNGEKTTFFKAGKGTAGTKTRHGLVPTMSLDHTKVECPVADYYAADYVDELDELKVNIDERAIVAKSGAAALGRKSDELIVTAASAAVGNALIAAGGAGLTQAKINTVFQRFGVQDVPEDGGRYFAVDAKGWTDLLGISAFSDADFIGADSLPYKGGMVARQWMGFTFMHFSGLAGGATPATEARALVWHRSCIGLGVGKNVTTKIDWIAERAAHLISSNMSMGAVNIDETGIQCIDYLK